MADMTMELKPEKLATIFREEEIAVFRREMPDGLLVGDRVYLTCGGIFRGVATIDLLSFARPPESPFHDDDCSFLALLYADGYNAMQAAYSFLRGGARPGAIVLTDIQRFD